MRNERIKFMIFSTIGVFNTLFDIAVYTVILNVEGSILIANLVATSLALIGSYLLNSRLTFKSKKWTTSSFLGFVLVTVFGLWILQTTAIYGIVHLLNNLSVSDWQIFGRLSHVARQVIPKVLATGVTFVWNYGWYNKVIFRDVSRQQSAILALDEL
jgi:putative flippase GtrA